ncbi:DUF6602 domain-containing protein [Xanthomonas euvesicatoria]|uniref:DUF6602 domain-containing protein n=1 Tax=Xanthomonas euvesicatoria TaxID=456327 RepID=UPI0024059431|nr:DUF6602 domain-containing protein [Xanthomonas euvesicatoria]MCP3043278.1 hypothetical protein [Xanthomonas euvesicatoria pv. allii]
MTQASLAKLLDHLHVQVEAELKTARSALHHPTDKGDASEQVWINLLSNYLPKRYVVSKAHVVDSEGNFSQQIDVVVHDRQYSPLVFTFQGLHYVPAESVYAIFEAKQETNAQTVNYAQTKAESVRRLIRTSMPVPTVDGPKPAKEPGHILAGLLSLSCPWKPPLGEALACHVHARGGDSQLDMGCIADAGIFFMNDEGALEVQPGARAATRFLLELMARLQELGTVPMLDIRSYARHIL